jgi:hypothetical protein
MDILGVNRMDEYNEFTIAHEPEKKFLLISELQDGHQMVTWHETKEDLLWCAKNNKCLTAIDAIEICTCKEIDLDSKPNVSFIGKE